MPPRTGLVGALLVVLPFLGACHEHEEPRSGTLGAGPRPTVTVTDTVTETVTERSRPLVVPTGSPPLAPDSRPDAEERPDPPPQLSVTVFRDGCGVIRSEPPPGASYQNLVWSVEDADGFQVLQRNAEGETRYRYFRPGVFTVRLEAYVDGAYRAVSNQVTIRC